MKWIVKRLLVFFIFICLSPGLWFYSGARCYYLIAKGKYMMREIIKKYPDNVTKKQIYEELDRMVTEFCKPVGDQVFNMSFIFWVFLLVSITIKFFVLNIS